MSTTAIICPLSGHPKADRAITPAVELAVSAQAKLTLFSAVETEVDVDTQMAYLDGCSAEIASAHPGLDVRPRIVVEPHAPEAIAAESTESNIIVMATSTSPLLHDGYVGSAAEHVVRGSHRPTMLIGPHFEHSMGELETVVVPIDGSALSEAALPLAETWAKMLGIPLLVVSVISQEDIDAATKALGPQIAGRESQYVRRRAEAHGAGWEVLHGDHPAAAVLSAAGDSSLIVMSTHGRSGLRRLVMGSVTTSVVRDSTTPVVVVNPPVT
ncbi:MAG: universal stress protein [Actinomycetia bacterium]|nr:universal stress protein [Actinomycetes bacterium]MCP4960753.1 universal stress protein [Actinomycetes bacterium]